MADIDQLRADLMTLDTELRHRLTFAVVKVAGDIKDATRRHEWKNQSTNTENSVPDPVVKETMMGAEASITVTDPNALRLQYGTKPHVIMPRGGLAASAAVKSNSFGGQKANASVLRFEVGGTPVFARSVQHPGTPAYGWLDKAADEGEAAIDAAVESAIDDALASALG